MRRNVFTILAAALFVGSLLDGAQCPSERSM